MIHNLEQHVATILREALDAKIPTFMSSRPKANEVERAAALFEGSPTFRAILHVAETPAMLVRTSVLEFEQRVAAHDLAMEPGAIIPLPDYVRRCRYLFADMTQPISLEQLNNFGEDGWMLCASSKIPDPLNAGGEINRYTFARTEP